MDTTLSLETDNAQAAPEEIAELPPSSLPSEDWHITSQPVFVIEDSFYRSRNPARPVHWSIAWSDLMMTMFILFLTLFAHQRTHQTILAHGVPNKVADETIPVARENNKTALLFPPISQEIAAPTKRPRQEGDQSFQEHPGTDVLISHKSINIEEKSASSASAASPGSRFSSPKNTSQAPPPSPPKQETGQDEVNIRIYDLSKTTLAREKLEEFASIELVPDKTVRIILRGDLLYPSGQAELTKEAIASLKKLTAVIAKTPYMINVIGHTDDRPIHSAKFPSNWELSLARASGVARFLIQETGLPANQFSVAGYSAFRPVKPNTTEENRQLNRRVEIILSKERPPAIAPTPDNLH